MSYPLTDLLLRGLELSDDERGVENGLVGWVDECANALAQNRESGIGYYRKELGVPPRHTPVSAAPLR